MDMSAMLMETFILDRSRQEKLTARGTILGNTLVKFMTVSGLEELGMAMACGRTAKVIHTWVNGEMAKLLDMESSLGVMEISMKANSRIL